jgi:signal transduction histidine kinase
MPRLRFLQPLATGLRELANRVVGSRRVGRLANLPPFASTMRAATRLVVRPGLTGATAHTISDERITRGNLLATLQDVVDDVVQTMGYNIAMVALYEQGDTLTIHAIQFDPQVLTRERIQQWEQQLSLLIGRPVGITDPRLARTYVYRDEYDINLSVKAARSQRPVVSDSLFDLFAPITPEFTRPIIDGIQQELGIAQVIAVPFFLETSLNGRPTREMVGNLFAARPQPISDADIAILSAFGRQAAAAILSERQRVQIELAQELVLKIQTSLEDEAQLLRYIAEGVVAHMGFTFAMVATYEPDGSLPLRAFYFDPEIIPEGQVTVWEDQISRFLPGERQIRLTDTSMARIYVDRPEYRENLGVQAILSGSYEVSGSLFDIFTPIVPPLARPAIDAIQQELGIQQVITVPFFLERLVDGELRREPVGNLFTVTRSRSFRAGEIQLLQAFGQQAAAGLCNARLYRQAEDRRAAAQMFGRMAFTASASVHALKNHIGAVRLPLQLINMAIKSPGAFPEEERQKLLASLEKDSALFRHLDAAADTLDTLHEPWRQMPDTLIDVNACITRALSKVIPGSAEWVVAELADDLPQIHSAPDMLTEALKVLIKNAVEAIENQDGERMLQIVSRRGESGTVEIVIDDNGCGIKPENLARIFDMRWSTKPGGLGFGLFWTRDYIQGLGGQIHVHSMWQQGTTFTLSLPVPNAKAAPALASAGTAAEPMGAA